MSNNEIKIITKIDDRNKSRKLMSKALSQIILNRIEELPLDERMEAYISTLNYLNSKYNDNK